MNLEGGSGERRGGGVNSPSRSIKKFPVIFEILNLVWLQLPSLNSQIHPPTHKNPQCPSRELKDSFHMEEMFEIDTGPAYSYLKQFGNYRIWKNIGKLLISAKMKKKSFFLKKKKKKHYFWTFFSLLAKNELTLISSNIYMDLTSECETFKRLN